ncbi:hypothetical protein Trydic_g22724 [Trypoxylus dichotomus]
MEGLIREGALRLLTSESSCDVILSCKGYRLMAHKVILSIASPVLQELLRQDDTVPTVIIFPDISGNTMSLILDYIYSGSVNVRSDILTEFTTIAHELKLQIDSNNLKMTKYFDSFEEKIKPNCKFITSKLETDLRSVFMEDECKFKEVNNPKIASDQGTPKITNSVANIVIKKSVRKMPNLLPLSKIKRRKVLYNHITPSPWCPRIAPLLADPREGHLPTTICAKAKHTEENDTNNNFKIQNVETTPPPRETTDKNSETTIPQKDISTSHPILNIKLDSKSNMQSNDSSKTENSNSSQYPLNMKAKLDFNENNTIAIKKNSGTLKSKTFKPVLDDTELDTNPKAPRSKRSNVSTLRIGDNKKPFSCEDCGKSFRQLRNFKYHRSIHEGTKEFSARCPECGKTFNNKGYLSSHMKIHRDRKEYGCPHCPKRFNQRVAYNMHLRIHTGVKPHECPTCSKTFSRKMLLKQHQRVHTGERPYSCPECGKSFADRSNMILHARLHTGIKPYTCNLCSKSFTKKHHLKTHMNFHTGLKPYSCEKCGLAFSQSSNMRTHYKKCILKPTDILDIENT